MTPDGQIATPLDKAANRELFGYGSIDLLPLISGV